MAATDPPPPLKILILGAGIAGLTFALALLKTTNHHVTILEKASADTYSETGAAVYVAPNASGHLRRLGWDPAKSGAVLCEGLVGIDLNGKVLIEKDLKEWSKQFKEEWLLCHRVDLHRALRELVEEAGGVVELGVKVDFIDPIDGLVKESSTGREWQTDIIVGADGNKSFARTYVDATAKLRPWGKSCYRWLIPKSTILADPETRDLVPADGYFVDVAGPDRKFVIYPCRNNSMLNAAAFLPDEEVSIERAAGWNSQGSKESMLKGFSTFYPQARKFLTYAPDDVGVWTLLDMAPLDHWNENRVVLIGDAAHPFLPFLGQGAAQSIEDAISLATFLPDGTRREEVEELLGVFDEVRRERVDLIQEATRKNGADGEGKPPPSFLMDMLHFCYRHDEAEKSRLKLEQWRKARQSNL